MLTTYTYGAGTMLPKMTLNALPRSYRRLGEASGTAAASAVVENMGTDMATYVNVALGQPGPVPGSSVMAGGFNGTSSRVDLPGQPIGSAVTQTISLWFKANPGDRGPLYSYTGDPLTGWAGGGYVPALYIATNGQLYGQFWNGTVNQIRTSFAVNDGAWHHVALTTQSAQISQNTQKADGTSQEMYVDGVSVGFKDGPLQPFGAKYATVGAGFFGRPGRTMASRCRCRPSSRGRSRTLPGSIAG